MSDTSPTNARTAKIPAQRTEEQPVAEVGGESGGAAPGAGDQTAAAPQADASAGPRDGETAVAAPPRGKAPAAPPGGKAPAAPPDGKATGAAPSNGNAAPAVHALPDSAFVALGAGRPSLATIEVLRRSQLSKHLLLLREIALAEPGNGYADLIAAEGRDPAAVRRALADPMFGAWAAAHLAYLRRTSADRRRTSPRTGGRDHPSGETPYLSKLAATITGLGAGRGGRDDDNEGDGTRGGTRWLVASHDGMGISVRFEDSDPGRGRLGLRPAARLSEGDFHRWRELFAEAWRLLVTRHRADAEVLAAVLEVIVPVEPDPAARGISATSADAFGAVAMSFPADATAFSVGLLHEIQHSLLNAVNYLFDLDREPAALGYSPWRDDPRPASGILQGAYAYLTVTRFWRAEMAAGRAAGTGLAAFEFVRWREAVAGAARWLLERGSLTPAGERFVGALLDEVQPWLDEVPSRLDEVPTRPDQAPTRPDETVDGAELDETVDGAALDGTVDGADILRLAEGANADHRLRWRLRNLVVDPPDARALAEAWRRGERPPADAIRSRLVPAPRRALESSVRLDLAHAWVATKGLRSPRASPGSRASAGDIAYLGGDGGTAADAYKKDLEETDPADARPDDDAFNQALAGLALVRGWERVEILAALYRELRAEAGLTTVAGWLFG